MSSYWGYHLMLDCSGCNDNVSQREVIYTFIKDLVEQIDMVAQGDPKQGYSLMQLITTSNICAHFMDLDGTAYFDIFSCKEYDIDLAQKIVQQYFAPEKMRVNFITRHAD